MAKEKKVKAEEQAEEPVVSEETAAEDACLIEHVLSDESFEAIKKHLQEKSLH